MSSATKQEIYLEVTDDFDAFEERTGLLSSWELARLGFQMNDLSGMFWECSTGILLEFCKNNSQYHIVSASCGRFENRYVPGKNVYMLAEGDRNPNLVLDMCLKRDQHLLMDEMLEKALAMNHSVNRGDKTE
jgi:hypothetical protein